jgi:hypothetical protein
LSIKKRDRKDLLISPRLTAKSLSNIDDEIEALEAGIARTEKYIGELF